MKKYISDIITDYISWRPGAKIMISAPTGSGKSYFVFEKLLKNAVKQDKHIIYFCNRKSLKNQMSESAYSPVSFGLNYNLTREERNHM